MKNRRNLKILSAALWLPLFLTTVGPAQVAERLGRATIWDIKLGQPIAAQPAADAFQNFACGASGGPPRLKLTGWSDFAKCAAEASGLHEVYFEYDDENEYFFRAHDMEREISRWAGTTENAFPIVASVLFDDAGIARGIRLVTDARPGFRNDVFEAEQRKRELHYQFGGSMSARYNIEADKHCVAHPLAEGEGKIAGLAIKRSCELIDQQAQRRYVVQMNYFRKPGQSGYDPRVPTRTTQGEFESSSRFEMYTLAKP